MGGTRRTDEELLLLHERLAAGDPAASAELAEALFDELIERLERFSNATPEDAADAVSLTLMGHFKNPSSYIKTRSKLRTYLCLSAKRDLLNLREKADRRKTKEKSVADVEDYEDGRNKIIGQRNRHSDRPDWLYQVKEGWEIVEREFPDSCDQEIIRMMLAGERHSEAYARLLGIGDEPLECRRKIVKQHKDRIQKRLKRLQEKYSNES